MKMREVNLRSEQVECSCGVLIKKHKNSLESCIHAGYSILQPLLEDAIPCCSVGEALSTRNWCVEQTNVHAF